MDCIFFSFTILYYDETLDGCSGAWAMTGWKCKAGNDLLYQFIWGSTSGTPTANSDIFRTFQSSLVSSPGLLFSVVSKSFLFGDLSYRLLDFLENKVGNGNAVTSQSLYWWAVIIYSWILIFLSLLINEFLYLYLCLFHKISL